MCSHNVLIVSGPKVIPDFGVACRRLTPGPGYLEALCEDNVRDKLLERLPTITLDLHRWTLYHHGLSE
jgi:hypothetical protein